MSDPIQRFTPDAEAAGALRRAFGRYGTGVTVITTLTEQGPLGITANSFTSVSLDPPLVLWSPARSSARHDAFANAPHFAIHVLSVDQRALADHFARNGDGFDKFDWTEGPHGAPCLSDCLATFHCDTYAVHPAGDHSLILGEIRSADVHESDTAGLMFDRGRYGQFAQKDG